jgi:D-glucuronyl C5-epimerase-like protein
VRGSLLVLLAVAAVAFPATAAAAPVMVLGHDGRATVRNDPFVTGPAVTPVPSQAPAGRGRVAAGQETTAFARAGSPARAATTKSPAKPKPKRKGPPPITFLSEMARLYRAKAVNGATYHGDVAAYNGALAVEKRLRGTRRTELEAVTETMHNIASSHQLTPSRLPALMATLAANRQWWTTGPLLSADQRVEFAGSQLLWEYYPGQGIQLQVLGTFGKADGLFTGGAGDYPALEQLLSEMIPLAAQRGGGLTWEYYFSFDGGSPPWTSAMSQATGLEALTRAYQATANPYYLNVATRALPIFKVAPPTGVSVRTPRGTRFLQYTFAPQTAIINAFLQTLIGLYDFAHASGNATAAGLFAAGNAEAEAEVPAYNTGAWSLYQPGVEDDLSYHELVTGFLAQLCARTAAPVYCTTAQDFQTDLTTPPALSQLTGQAKTKAGFPLRFRLSKYSHVGIVITQGSRTVFSTSANFPYGVDNFTVPRLRQSGTYDVVLAATDLAGNFARVTGSLQVSK